nr:immunoglobulin heavy chain junction region [Macaca mulatta]MOV44583.1 immunoglobulin heavy chain junction region [Macaca mulatta]MOV44726.1 immunoglobulin heavy chain junction region [Macaca mulatta]
CARDAYGSGLDFW